MGGDRAIALYALLGSSRQLSVGPESTTALMTAVVLAPIVIGDPARYAALAAVLALLVGAICLLGGIARLGFLANLLSRPVLIGYMTGIAIVMIASQLGKTTGVAVQGDEFIHQIRSFAAGIGQTHWPTVVLSALVLLLLLSLAHWLPRAPGPVIAVLVATASVGALSLDTRGIAVVGHVPSGLPTPGLPPVSLSDLATLVVPAVGIAIVAFSDNVLSARAFATRRSEEIDANAELRAVGMCNIAAGVTHGFPVSSSGSRTAVGDIVGSRTQLYSLIALGCVVVVLVFAGGLLAMFPTAALGALVVFAALHLIDIARVSSPGAVSPQRTDPRLGHHGGRVGLRRALRRCRRRCSLHPGIASPPGARA